MLKAVSIMVLGLAILFFLSGCYTQSSKYEGQTAHSLHHDMVVRRDFEGIHGDIDWIIKADRPSPLRRDFAR